MHKTGNEKLFFAFVWFVSACSDSEIYIGVVHERGVRVRYEGVVIVIILFAVAIYRFSRTCGDKKRHVIIKTFSRDDMFT